MTTKTHAQRKAEQRAKKKAAGMVPMEVWVFPEQRGLVRDYVNGLPVPAAHSVLPGQQSLPGMEVEE